jgi:hypothetical protein
MLARTLRRKWRLGGTPLALSRHRRREHSLRIHSIIKDSRFLRRGAWPVMLDKAGGDMVLVRLNLWPPKENEASGISIHRLLYIKDLRS